MPSPTEGLFCCDEGRIRTPERYAFRNGFLGFSFVRSLLNPMLVKSLPSSALDNTWLVRKVRDSSPPGLLLSFLCCFLLLSSGLKFQKIVFVHTGITRFLHDFPLLEKLCKGTKIIDICNLLDNFFLIKMIYSFSNYFPKTF